MSEEHFQSFSVDNFFLNDSCTEQCFFTWTVKNFSYRMFQKTKPHTLGTLTFSPSKKEYSTLWLLELSKSEFETLELSVTLLDSKILPKVFMKLCATIVCGEVKKFVPLSIHSDFTIGDRILRTLLNREDIMEKYCSLSLNENLNISCELIVGGQPPEKFITFKIKERSSKIQKALSSYLDIQHRTDINKDVYSARNSEMKLCYNSALISRNCVLNDFIYSDKKDNCFIHLSTCTSKSVYVILKNLYCDVIKYYLNHVELNKLSEVFDQINMSHLQNLINYISYQNNAIKRCINVTWIIPLFKSLLQRQYVTFCCPGQESGILLHNKWKLQLILGSTQNYASIYIHKVSSNTTSEFLKFTVKILHQGKVKFEKTDLFYFLLDNTQGWKKFLSKNELCSLLSKNDLVLKCFLEVVNPPDAREIYNERNFFTREHSHLMMAIDSFQRHGIGLLAYIEQIFKDYFLIDENLDFITAKCSVEKLFDAINLHFRIHSCVLSVCFLFPISNIYAFLQCMDLDLSNPLIGFHVRNILDALYVLGVESYPQENFISEIYFYRHELRCNLIEKLYETTTSQVESHSFELDQENGETTRNESIFQNSTLRDDYWHVSNLPYNDNTPHSDHDSSFEADNEVESINENPSQTCSTHKQGRFQVIITKGAESYSIVGSHYVHYPKPINKNQVPSNQTLNSESTFTIKSNISCYETDSLHSTENSTREPDARLNPRKKPLLNLNKDSLVRVISPQDSNVNPQTFNLSGHASNDRSNNRMNQTVNSRSNESLLPRPRNITQTFGNNVINYNNSSAINRQILYQPVYQPLYQPVYQPLYQPVYQPLYQPLYLTVGNFPSLISSNFTNNYNYSSFDPNNQGSPMMFRQIYPLFYSVRIRLPPPTETHIPVVRNNFIDYVPRNSIFPNIQPLHRYIGVYHPRNVILSNLQTLYGSIRNYNPRNATLPHIQPLQENNGNNNPRSAIRINMQPSYRSTGNCNPRNSTLSNIPHSFRNNDYFYPRNTTVSSSYPSYRNIGNYHPRDTTVPFFHPLFRNIGIYNPRYTVVSHLQPLYRNIGNYQQQFPLIRNPYVVSPTFGTVYQSHSPHPAAHMGDFSHSQPISYTTSLFRAQNNLIVNCWPSQHQIQPILRTPMVNDQSNISAQRDILLDTLKPEIGLREGNVNNNSIFESVSEAGSSNSGNASEILSHKNEASYKITETSKLPHWRSCKRQLFTSDSDTEHQSAYNVSSCTESMRELTSNNMSCNTENISTNDALLDIDVDSETYIETDSTPPSSEDEEESNESNISKDLI